MITYYVIRQVGTENYLPQLNRRWKTSLIGTIPTNINNCIPRMYRTQQGATYAMNYYRGEVRTKKFYDVFYTNRGFNLEVVPVHCDFE